VRDHGPGIPEEKQGKVFQKFFRLHPGQVQGFGLGLSYVQQVVKLHGGEVSLYNHPDGGAVFGLLLPGFEPGETGVAPQLQTNG
jgi:two-component system sensor histidine kinase MprB